MTSTQPASSRQAPRASARAAVAQRAGRRIARRPPPHRFWLTAGLALAACNLLPEPVETVLPPADAEPGRWIVLQGANNTRDIGGYATQSGKHVRWKTVYRSGELSGLTPSGCAAYQALGIRRLIDFRNRLSTSPLFGGDAPCVISTTPATLLPVRMETRALTAPVYVQCVAENAADYARAFALLADASNLPMLYHCAAGKDRSGIMTALLLALLGVDRETIVADYMLSNHVYSDEVEARNIIDVLEEADRQGGIETYLENIGVSAQTQAAVRANLLE